jgi:hypothetical protein
LPQTALHREKSANQFSEIYESKPGGIIFRRFVSKIEHNASFTGKNKRRRAEKHIFFTGLRICIAHAFVFDGEIFDSISDSDFAFPE